MQWQRGANRQQGAKRRAGYLFVRMCRSSAPSGQLVTSFFARTNLIHASLLPRRRHSKGFVDKAVASRVDMSAPPGHTSVKKRSTINVGALHTGSIHDFNKEQRKTEQVENAWGAMFAGGGKK